MVTMGIGTKVAYSPVSFAKTERPSTTGTHCRVPARRTSIVSSVVAWRATGVLALAFHAATAVVEPVWAAAVHARLDSAV
jgi:hypothetical protein